MARFFKILIGLVVGYGVGVLLGAAAVTLFSANTHDKSMELAMTSALITGPIGALIGLVVGLVRGNHRST